MPAVSLSVRPRSPALANVVASLGYVQGEHPDGRERVLPDGRVHLMVNLHEDAFRIYDASGKSPVCRTRGAVLQGPQEQPAVIDTAEQRCLLDVRFSLGGAVPFFAAPLAEARDRLIGLEDLWGRAGEVLRERLLEVATPQARLRVLEAALLERVVGPLEGDPAVARAAARLAGGAAVSEVAAGLGMLPKRFVGRFRRRVGLTPKRFARVRRLQRVLRAIEPGGAVDWAAVAAAHGYCDQAHLINDFRDLTGTTPTAYRPRSPAERNHLPLAPPPHRSAQSDVRSPRSDGPPGPLAPSPWGGQDWRTGS